jgi:hypothetical protein
MNFQENPPNGRDTSEKVHCFSGLLPLIIDRNLLQHARRVGGVNYQINPSHGSRDTAEKAHCFPSQEPQIIERPQQRLQSL